jgi:hypothetical protein
LFLNFTISDIQNNESGSEMFKQALDRPAERSRPIQVGFVGAGRTGGGRDLSDAVADIDMERILSLLRATQDAGGEPRKVATE